MDFGRRFGNADADGMASKARVAVQAPARTGIELRSERPSFHLLRPRRPTAGLPLSAEDGIAYLQFIAGEEDARIAQALVHASFRTRAPAGTVFVREPSISVRNRRRRAARLWVNAILAGDVSAPALKALTHSWLPQLAGTGPDAWRGQPAGRRFVEYLRGAFTAAVMTDAMPCLIRHAKALHALESILAVHLGAIVSVPRPRAVR